jgi:hypothetical protein
VDLAVGAAVCDICAVAGEGRRGGTAAAAEGTRRTSQRFPLNADVEILEPWSAHGVVINASEGGLRIAVDSELPVGTLCVLEVQLEDSSTVEVARVAWVKGHPDGFLIGLSFVNEE